ncbi:hypothetical protein OVA06_19540 [Pseudarthrobacter sp. SL88]|uniref:hypothetical protein n=1 Tax=Pseudarthrobacter sp. SL88 TaxID=2994666 RepID=UPI002272423F|nr:hypothetical protein [Pseudarthrobacter sp. SL88]MCY1676867.1 hypothetical protein [Pseudarthrobacter sp. SL88]
MDILAAAIAIVGGVTGLSGFIISVRADRRATRADKRAAAADQRAIRAEEEGARARQRELWSEVISAMQDVVGANVLAQDLRPVLVRVRSSMMELVDGVTSDHYKRLDRWMSVEHKVINGLLEQTTVQLAGSGHTMKQIQDAHHAPNEWAASFINNLRVARKLEPSPEVEAGIEDMIAAGEKALRQLPEQKPPQHSRSNPAERIV